MKLLSPRLAPLAIWAVLMIALMIFRPQPNTALFWLLIVPGFAAGGLHMWLSHMDSRRLAREWSAWEVRFRSLVDVNDVEDDGHLYEWFDPPEWERIFLELEKMPPGTRNLRVAINAVNPDVLRQDA
jgi:hypothetical protein